MLHRSHDERGHGLRAPRVGSVLAAALLAACAARWAPEAEEALPDGGIFTGGGQADPAVCARLGGAPLQSLIRTAFSDSPTLAQSWARLAQARAASRAQTATLLPSLGLSVERVETGGDGATAAGGLPAGSGQGISGGASTWQAGAAASYELDFWGRLHNRREAARLSARAAEADLRTATLTLAADVATAWAGWVTAAGRVETLTAQSRDAKALVRLQALRFGQGQTDALALTQARQEAAAIASRLAEARGEEQNARVRLAVLLGGAPNVLSIQAPSAGLPAMDELPAPGLPSDLLAARPDLKAAWLRLRAADAEAAAAAAERWPRLTLSANLFYQASELRDIFDESIHQVAAALDWTIFSGGALAARQAESEARALERLYALQQAWLQALAEVQTALDAERAAGQRVSELQEQLRHAGDRLALAHRRYARGQTAYLEVLSAQQAVNGAELELLAARNAGFVQRVNLCRGLAASVSEPLPKPVLMRTNREENS